MDEVQALAETRLIVGLGNPEKKYQGTRHNFGFLIVEKLAGSKALVFRRDSLSNALITRDNADGMTVFFMLPLTYMNLSGQAVSSFVKNKNIKTDQILIVCDDLDLPFGQIRMRAQGSAGGHNGIKSVIECLGSNQFPRLRAGIGRPQVKEQKQTVDFVLDQFLKTEENQLPSIIARAADCCRVWLDQGVEEAMSQFNQRKKDE